MPDSCGTKVSLALDYLIRWDYISIRGRAQSGSSCLIQIDLVRAAGGPAHRKENYD